MFARSSLGKKEHPEWLKDYPKDGTIQYAENPPKNTKVYPLNFESENWHSWQELKHVIMTWASSESSRDNPQ
jgi:hypothetical protein